MKNKFLYTIGIIFLAMILTSCASVANFSGESRLKANPNRKAVGLFPSILDVKRKVVVTTFPLYEATKTIIEGHEDKFDLIWLQDGGAGIHSYEPTQQAVSDVKSADLVVYLGQSGDEWIDEICKAENEKDSKKKSINLKDYFKGSLLPVSYEINYMKDSQAAERNQAYLEKMDKKEGVTKEYTFDDHFWFSLSNQQYIARMIYQALHVMDEKNFNDYYKNTETYCEKLEKLENEYRLMKKKTNKYFVIVGDKFPYRYLFNDFKISYSAIYNTCNDTLEPAYSKVDHLAEIIDERKIPVVLVTESSDKAIAYQIINKTATKNQKVLVFNSMQNVSKEDVDSGVTFYSVMKENYEVLEEALK